MPPMCQISHVVAVIRTHADHSLLNRAHDPRQGKQPMKTNLIPFALCFILGIFAALSLPYAFADVTDSEAITISNEIVRPVAEDLRAVYYKMLSIKNQYSGRLNTLFPASGGNIIDGRDGITPITADDVRKILLFANTYIAAYENEGIAAMTKPCVRQIQVQ